MDRCSKTINKRTSEAFRRHFMSVVDDDILNLPPIHSKIVQFEAQLDAAAVQAYNVCLHKTHSLKMELERNGQVSQEDLRRLAALLAENQQRLVSPELAQRGAAHFDAPEHPIHNVTATGACWKQWRRSGSCAAKGYELMRLRRTRCSPCRFAQVFGGEHVGRRAGRCVSVRRQTPKASSIVGKSARPFCVQTRHPLPVGQSGRRGGAPGPSYRTRVLRHGLLGRAKLPRRRVPDAEAHSPDRPKFQSLSGM